MANGDEQQINLEGDQVVAEPTRGRKFRKVNVNYEADRVWDRFRQVNDINVNQFTDRDDFERQVVDIFKQDEKLGRFKDVGQGQLKEEALNWYDSNAPEKPTTVQPTIEEAEEEEVEREVTAETVEDRVKEIEGREVPSIPEPKPVGRPTGPRVEPRVREEVLPTREVIAPEVRAPEVRAPELERPSPEIQALPEVSPGESADIRIDTTEQSVEQRVEQIAKNVEARTAPSIASQRITGLANRVTQAVSGISGRLTGLIKRLRGR